MLTRALDAATPMHGQIFFVNGRQVGRIELALPSDVPYGFVALPQYETERLLADRLAELGGRGERGVDRPAGGGQARPRCGFSLDDGSPIELHVDHTVLVGAVGVTADHHLQQARRDRAATR